MLPALRTYQEINGDEELELANLNQSANSAPHEVKPLNTRHKWHLPPWVEIKTVLQQRNCQRVLWVLSAALLLIAGLLLAILRPTSPATPSTPGGTSSAVIAGEQALTSDRAAATPLPSGLWLQPSGPCLDSSGSLGPAAEIHSPLGYRVYLSLLEQHFAAGDQEDANAAGGFAAASNVTLAVHQETACVRLHVADLTFSTVHASVVAGGGGQQQHQAVCLCGHVSGCLVTDCGRLFKEQSASDSWLMSLGSLTAPGGSTLLISTAYTAHFNSSGTGLWRSSSFDTSAADGTLQQQVLVSSQLETKGARRVFPCMDEPKYKAPIVVLVEAPSRLTILSNMPEAQRSVTSSNRVLVEFLPSPPMSTYLMAVAVGDMQAVTANTTKGQVIRLWFPRNHLTSPEAAAVPLQLAVAAFNHYARYTRVSQPLRKFDLVAVPGKGGAMENWGLLMFDAERLLYSLPGAWSLLRSADVICHEVAHQWFGNLVTAVSWSDLLVNEGLASLLEYGCLAQVLQGSLGAAGAAAVMRRVITPHGRKPGVHEGPYHKALTYDSLPTASPLLGSLSGSDADVDFGVLVYSKAASVMAMWTQYAAASSASKSSFRPAMSGGPVSQLVETSPAGVTQVALQQFLHQHIYSSASVQQVLQLFLSEAPADLSSNSVAVLTGLRAPGSPLMMVEQQQEGKVSVSYGRRFCQWGLLDSSLIDQLLHGTANMSTASAGDSSVLSCPRQVDDIGDRAVPWTPVFLSQLTFSTTDAAAVYHDNSSSVGSREQTQEQGSSSLSTDTGFSPVCGVWQVVKQDTQQLQLPTGATCIPPDSTSSSSSPAAAAAAANSSSSTGLHPLMILEGDGGWGLYRSVYQPQQRAATRNWISTQLVQQLRQQVQQQRAEEGSGSSTTSGIHNDQLDLRLLFTASRLLDDQAVVALSPFNHVPGWEVKAAIEAAAQTAAAAAAQARESELGRTLFGHVLYSLLVPLLPSYEAVLDRIVGDTFCWNSLQVDLSTLLSPIADVALEVFTTSRSNSLADVSSGSVTHPLVTLQQQQCPSSGRFLGAMTLNTLITTAALMDKETAGKVCNMFNVAAAAAAGADVQPSAGAGAVFAGGLMSALPADLQAAVLSVAASRPEGCELNMTVDEVYQLLLTLYLTSPHPAVCTTAAYALAHSANTATAAADSSVPAWQATLSLLLGIDSISSSDNDQPTAKSASVPAGGQKHHTMVPACGVSPSAHADGVAKLMSRAVMTSTPQQAADKQRQSPENGDEAVSLHQVGPVLDYVIDHWSSVMSSLGSKDAWQLVVEVSGQEVVTWLQWRKLADWLLSQYKQQQTSDEHVLKQQRQWMQSVLGSAWSTVVWVDKNSQGLCSR